MTQPGNFGALVHVRADQVLGAVFLETGLAVTPVRPERIDAFGVVRTHHTFVHLALVDVLAPLVFPDNETGGTVASVTAVLVLTYLARAALRFAGAALVYVCW